MSSAFSRILSRSTLVLGTGLLGAAPAFAYTDFALDRLEVEWARASAGLHVTYTDEFDDGNPLTGPNYVANGAPSASTGVYFVTTRSGGPPAAGSESGGKLRFAWDDMLDSSFGSVVNGRSMNYILSTGTGFTPDTPTLPRINRGLFKANDFRVTTVWDFQLGAETDHIRARLTDAFTGYASNDLLDLSVRTTGGGTGFRVQQRRLNIAPGTSDETVWSDEMGAWLGQFDQIALTFEHNAGEDVVHTFFTLLSGGAVVDQDHHLGTLSLFHGEDWTRASFGSFALSAPIPEPQTWLMLALGLGALGVAGRRRRLADQA